MKNKEAKGKTETDYNIASTASLADSTSSVPTILDTYSEICAEVIQNYFPKYFLGEPMNPACENCQDSSISSDDEQNDEIKEPLTWFVRRAVSDWLIDGLLWMIKPKYIPLIRCEIKKKISDPGIFSIAVLKNGKGSPKIST